MASEDMREDLIENEPSTCIEDTSVDEKTWSWLVHSGPLPEQSGAVCMLKYLSLISFQIVTHFVYLPLLLFRWHSFRTLCDYNKRICLGKRAHCEAPAWGKVSALRNNYGRVWY